MCRSFVAHVPTTPAEIGASGMCGSLVIDSCPPPAYEIAGPSWSSDRQCGRRTIICNPATQYETIPFTVSTDRACASLTPCALPTLYTAVIATATSNRVCGTVRSPCNTSAFYQSQAPTQTSDRQCQQLATCGVAVGMTTAATPTSDRVCVPCVQGQAFKATVGNTACTPVGACPPATTFASIPPTVSSDVRCQNLTQCGTNEYAAVQPTATSDRSGCTGVRLCSAGLGESAPPTASSDRTCTPCAVGTFSPTLDTLPCTAFQTCAADR